MVRPDPTMSKLPVADRWIATTGGASWGLAAAVVALLYSALACVFTPRFETMDDVAMAMWASGQCFALEPESHIIFSHQAVGWLLKLLYQAWPGVGWYGWFQVLALFGANVTICQTLRRAGGWRGLLAFLAFFSLTQVDAFETIQFTKTSFYVTVAAILPLAAANRGLALNRRLLAVATSLGLLGALIRPESYAFGIFVCFPAFAWAWWQEDGGFAAFARRRWAGVACFLGVPLAVFVLTSVVDRTGSWREYYQYRDYRAQVRDFGEHILYNEQTRAVFDQIDWKESHLQMVREASYFDHEIFGGNQLRHLAEAFPKPRWPDQGLAQLGGFVRSLQKPAYAALLLAGALAITAGYRRKSGGPMIVGLLSAACLFAVLVLFFKFPPHRVLLPTLGGAYCLWLWFGLGDSLPPWRRNLFAAACGLAVLGAGIKLLPGAVTANQEFQKDSAAALGEFARLASNRSQLYFTWAADFPYERTFLPFNHHRELYENNLQVGSWAMHYHSAETMLRHFGVQRPYLDLVNHPRLFLIAHPRGVATYRRFMRDAFNREVDVVPVREGTKLQVWRVVAPR